MFINSIKRYLKTPVLICLTAIWLSWYIYGLAAADYNEFRKIPIYFLGTVQISFLFFMFVSYIFQSKSRQVCLDENISGIPHGMLRQVFSQFVFLLLFAVLISVGTYGYMYSRTEQFIVPDYTLTLFLAKLVFIHQFLPHLIAIFLGLAISGLKSEAVACCVLFGFYLLFNIKNIGMLETIFMGKTAWLNRIPRFLNLYSQSYGRINAFYYIFSVEKVNFQQAGAWLCIAAAVILLQKLPFGKKRFSSIPFLLGVVCLGLYLRPAGEIYLGDGDDDFWMGDQTHYLYLDEADRREQEADFKLTSVQADFKVDRLLEADVTLTVDTPDLKQYCFTLYHGYRMKNVRDQNGNSLGFTQDGDYLTVDSGGQSLSSLEFIYSGFNGHCYTTSQGIFLPAYMEYYPIPGFHTVYIQTPGYYGYTMDGLGYETDYQITVHTKEKVYSNLTSIGKNCFKGKSDAVSLYAGEFMQETTVGDCKVLYSPLDNSDLSVEKNPQEYQDFIRWYEEQSGEKLQLLCLPAGGNPEYYFGGSQLMGDILNLKEYYERYQMTGDWYQTLSEEELEAVEQMQKDVEELEREEESGE